MPEASLQQYPSEMEHKTMRIYLECGTVIFFQLLPWRLPVSITLNLTKSSHAGVEKTLKKYDIWKSYMT